MLKNPFFLNKGPFELNYLLKKISLPNNSLFQNDKTKISDFKNLNDAEKNDITFFLSFHYMIVTLSI